MNDDNTIKITNSSLLSTVSGLSLIKKKNIIEHYESPETACDINQCRLGKNCGPDAPYICLTGASVGGCSKMPWSTKTCNVSCNSSNCKVPDLDCSTNCQAHECTANGGERCTSKNHYLCSSGAIEGTCASDPDDLTHIPGQCHSCCNTFPSCHYIHRYTCDNGQCVRKEDGEFDNEAQCKASNCETPDQKYTCTNNLCTPDDAGEFKNEAQCKASNCETPDQKYTCTNNLCTADDAGEFDSKADCKASNCETPDQKYTCSWQLCTADNTGEFDTKADCKASNCESGSGGFPPPCTLQQCSEEGCGIIAPYACIDGLAKGGCSDDPKYWNNNPDCNAQCNTICCHFPNDPRCTPVKQKYTCTNNLCIPDDAGEFDDKALCLASGCEQKYTCTNNLCTQDDAGEFDDKALCLSSGCEQKYTCTNNLCTQDDAGEFDDKALCLSSGCEQKYTCTNNLCIPDDAGEFDDKALCLSSGCEQKYTCTNNLCIPDDAGEFDDKALCLASGCEQKYTCTNNLCTQDDAGEFDDKAQCKDSTCETPIPINWSCNPATGICFTEPDGRYSSFADCNPDCPVPPVIKYDCDAKQGVCIESPSGSHTSLTDCSSTCIKCDDPANVQSPQCREVSWACNKSTGTCYRNQTTGNLIPTLLLEHCCCPIAKSSLHENLCSKS